VEELILKGRVSVNNSICRELATLVNPSKDIVTVDGKFLRLPALVYYKFYKPRGIVCSMSDPHANETLATILKRENIPQGVVPAGRLDKESEGLLILTNDGELLHKLMHPSYGFKKVYRVLLDRRPSEKHLSLLRKGVVVEGYRMKPVKITRMGPQPKDEENPEGYWLEVVLIEGRKREIRYMMREAGFKVLRLVRIAHGPVNVGTLKPGEIRVLEEGELTSLLSQVRNTNEKRPVKGGAAR